MYRLLSTTCLLLRDVARGRWIGHAAADCGNSRHALRRPNNEFPLIPYRSLRLSLQARILALFLALMVVLQIGGSVLVNTVGTTAARTTIGDELIAGEQVFLRSLQQEEVRLIQGARLLAADYAFREADRHRRPRYDRLRARQSRQANRCRPHNVDRARWKGYCRYSRRRSEDGVPASPSYWRQQNPTMRPARSCCCTIALPGCPGTGARAIACCLGGHWIQGRRRARRNPAWAHAVSCIAVQPAGTGRLAIAGQHARCYASASRRLHDVAVDRFAAVDANGNAVYDAVALTRVLRLSTGSGHAVIALLQEPLDAAMEPFYRLQHQLWFMSLLAIIVSFIVSWLIARGIVRPVHGLVAVARRIAAGDYAALPPPSRNDEIGDLASAVRTMGQDIASRETRILDLAYRDPLTDLPNRAQFAERLEVGARRPCPRSGRWRCC